MRDDVLIVGAGPTGLALALWLTEQGVKVRIIDKSAGPSGTSRAMAVQARTLELCRQLGFADEVIAAGHPNPTLNIWSERQKRAQVSLGGAGAEMTPYPYILVYPQDRHERLLIAQLEKRGVRVERSTELLCFEDKGEKVEAVLKSGSGAEIVAEARYLVGCDGARSVVRHALGTGFPGGTYSQFFYVADVELSGPVADGEVHIALDRADFLALLSYGEPGQARLTGVMRDDQAGDPDDLTFSDVNHHVLEGALLRYSD